MKITKLGHCCLLIEVKDKKILTDPGAWSTLQNEVTGVDIILITHEHPDHLHVDSLKQVLVNNPGAKVVTNTSVGKLLTEAGIDFQLLENEQNRTVESIFIEGFGEKHEEVYHEFGQVQNTGYFIENKLFYPGDAFTNPGKPVDILAAPIVAPWGTFKSAIDYIREIKPRVCFPVHDGMLQKDRPGPTYRLPPIILEKDGIEFVPMFEGDTKEF